ncbi:DUF1531-domain-containing protein [Lojkania enalia]|uniref:DUF1531-domain-containing protein n=1 Tax=Lojkania enalia TaxID=147567 RepID=A0A9P4N2A7_9PLEO|nr:DUF1531-domain-containing protein [Didymosphaeria enalia]
MASTHDPEGANPLSFLTTYWDNFTRNTKASLERMQLKDYIRLIWIVGAYLLIRPYLMKLGEKMQTKAHEKDTAETAEIHPNQLRGKIEIPGVDDSDEDNEGEAKPGDWGRNARLRQRKFIRNALEKHEERLRAEQEDESDKEIEEFLTG